MDLTGLARREADNHSQPLPEGEIVAENLRANLAKKMLLPTFDVPEDCRGGRWLIVPMDNERYGFGYWAESEAEWDDMNRLWCCSSEREYTDEQVRGVREWVNLEPTEPEQRGGVEYDR